MNHPSPPICRLIAEEISRHRRADYVNEFGLMNAPQPKEERNKPNANDFYFKPEESRRKLVFAGDKL